MILVDSSVWIDVLSSRPTIPRELFDEHLEAGEVVSILPIKDEILCGADVKRIGFLKSALSALDYIDEDWSHADTWERIHDISINARQFGLSPLGVVDRMVILCAKRSSATLWTLDKKESHLAHKLGIDVHVS